jgi:hydroxybutyrate-dimer hydrolase
VPDKFDTETACLVAAPSSGSRGVYGAVGTSGEWALRHNCAVVYTDKGTGTGIIFNQNKQPQSYNLKGLLDDSNNGLPLIFSQKTTNKTEKEQYLVASKHAHSQHNPESKWGQYTLESIRFAKIVLGNLYGKKLTNKIKVIAASISNGGSAVIRAAEQDKNNLIDAVVAAEPSISPLKTDKIIIEDKYGRVSKPGRPLLDYVTQLGIYQPCALLAPEIKKSPFNYFTPSQVSQFKKRCENLLKLDMLKSNSNQSAPQQALDIIHQYGVLPEADLVSNFSVYSQLWPALGVTYSSSYAAVNSNNHICKYAFAATNQAGLPRQIPKFERMNLYPKSSGIIPTAGINLVKVNDGNILERRVSSDDWDLNGALCLRKIYEDSQQKPNTLFANMEAIKASGDLHNKPTIIVHGQRDGLIAVNHNSRAYVAFNKQQSPDSKLKYYEVENAQHFDAILSLPGFSHQLIPLHYYFEKSLDAMYQHLFHSKGLPPSQLVKTVPRAMIGGIVEDLSEKHLPSLVANPTHPIKVTPAKIIIPNQ